ncbi:MAG: hypothetical protein JWR26_2770, partial [Pedosphaera sp.]|nr:hypothetical protein [Pedosphaera sp.]
MIWRGGIGGGWACRADPIEHGCARGGVGLNAPEAAGSAFLQTEFAQQFVFGGEAHKIEVNGF